MSENRFEDLFKKIYGVPMGETRFAGQDFKPDWEPLHELEEEDEPVKIFSPAKQEKPPAVPPPVEISEPEEDGTKKFEPARPAEEEQPPEQTGEEEPAAPEEEPGSTEEVAAEEEEEEYEEGWRRRERKRAKRALTFDHKGRTGCLRGIMYGLLVLTLAFTIALGGWLLVCDMLALGKKDATAVVTVEENFTLDSVAEGLQKAGMIRYKWFFKVFAKLFHADRKIEPGTYELNSGYDYRALIVKMHSGAGSQVETTVTIPEGYTVKQIFELLDEKGVCSYNDLEKTAAEYRYKHEFLQTIPYGNSNRLEGYLFPDTYDFYLNDDPVYVINKMLNNFGSKVTNDMFEKASAMGYTMRQILAVASMVEKEAGDTKEMSMVASVIYNRLNSSDFPHLQIDATVQYALPERKAKLTNSDLEYDSPYNTYKYRGLPPGPIANPGIAAIKAALNPEVTDYYYYALGKEGTHRFFKYYSDFDSFVNSEDYGG